MTRSHTICEIESVAVGNHAKLLNWIHFELAESDRNGCLAEAESRLCCTPTHLPSLIMQCGKQWPPAVGVYALRYPGSWASIAGVRVADIQDAPIAGEMLRRIIEQLREEEFEMGLCTLLNDQPSTVAALELADFSFLANVQYQWLGISEFSNRNKSVAPEDDIQWLRLGFQDTDRLEEALEKSYVDTQDCPQLSDMRTTKNVVKGYQAACGDGEPLWWIAQSDGKDCGCLILSQRDPAFVELSYMGLVPEFRGKGLGRSILNQGISIAVERHAEVFVLSVDCRNAPALSLYRKCGFIAYREAEIWSRTFR